MRKSRNGFFPYFRVVFGEPELSPSIRGVLHDCGGNAGVGYALVLSAVLAVILAGAAMLGPSVEHALNRVSAGVAAPSRLRPLRSDDYSRDSVSEDIDNRVASGTRCLRVLVVLLMAGGATAFGVLGWCALRPSMNDPAEEEPAREEKPAVEKILWSRLNAKRELLWRQLMNDQDLMLKNRIEVRHVMSTDPIFVGKSTSGKQIGELLSKQRVSHLVVCDDAKHVLGVIKAADHRANPELSAEESMMLPQASVAPNTTLGAAISLLFEQGASFLPVVDQERLCGVLTPTDLVLTLHCSLQLWFRVAQTMQTNAGQAEELESANQSIAESTRQLGCRVRRLPQQVKEAIEDGDVANLDVELNNMMASVSDLMKQLEEARTQIQQRDSQLAELKEPSPDEVTGVASREEFDRFLERSLAGNLEAKSCVSLILYVAEGYRRLQREEGHEAADEHLRAAVQLVAEHIGSDDHVSRYSDNTLAILLPGTGVDAACKLGSRLSVATSALSNPTPCQPRMSIVSARRGESASEFLKRAEAAIKNGPGEPEAVDK